MDQHIFADPYPESQNLADPTDPDPKHWKKNQKHKSLPVNDIFHFPSGPGLVFSKKDSR